MIGAGVVVSRRDRLLLEHCGGRRQLLVLMLVARHLGRQMGVSHIGGRVVVAAVVVGRGA